MTTRRSYPQLRSMNLLHYLRVHFTNILRSGALSHPSKKSRFSFLFVACEWFGLAVSTEQAGYNRHVEYGLETEVLDRVTVCVYMRGGNDIDSLLAWSRIAA